MPHDGSSDPKIPKPVPSAGNEEGGPFSSEDEAPMPKIGEAELGALHIRVIALENLVIALLAEASERQIGLARNMARYIAPREGHTHHPLTIHAADHMIDLIERSVRFGSGELPRADDIE